ncbi:MAG: hypothetical protein EZS28_035369 [Streblomastix strix]|uniref:Uncharacterized protein n=1 Tax=Streblomastix strix TaxID=222440 RepID=A0A5J4UFS4_9EUKA|nr:MAG: hypothetical protein EZS28_035369 [Streblomastix strix]
MPHVIVANWLSYLENKGLSHHAIKESRTSSSVLFDKAGIKLEQGLISSIMRKHYRESAKIQKEEAMETKEGQKSLSIRSREKIHVLFFDMEFGISIALKDEIPKPLRVTDIRATALTKLISSGATKEEADCWSCHSQSAETVRRYYDGNNNQSAREAIAGSFNEVSLLGGKLPRRGAQRIVTPVAMKRPPQETASGEADNLLNNKANSGVSYTKGEVDNLPNNNANSGVSYTKGEVDNQLNNKANSGVSYTKGEVDNQLNNKANPGVSYTKAEDDNLLLLKTDKTQLIVSYTKGEDDALLLLKADKTQLIDSYTKGVADDLLNNKANSGVSYTKREDNALLLLKANQSTTYTKTEIDYLISQIEVGDVDLRGYLTLSTSQTIIANKTFNNACRFVSFIDGMATITGASFVKSGADDTVVLFGAGGTKPTSKFAGTPTDLSDYYTKPQTYSKIETDNKYVRLEGSIQQTITGRLKYVNPFGQTYDETQDPVANTYLTMSEVDSKLTNYVNTTNNQEINVQRYSILMLMLLDLLKQARMIHRFYWLVEMML